jgi:threonine dehydrogenase-like Zn-dependent dehydrogenase
MTRCSEPGTSVQPSHAAGSASVGGSIVLVRGAGSVGAGMGVLIRAAGVVGVVMFVSTRLLRVA